MLNKILPAPKHTYNPQNETPDEESKEIPETNNKTKVENKKIIPSYPNRRGFVPLSVDDFGDGGAYPELHIVQYPLQMGKPGKQQSQALVPVQVDDKGTIRTDMLVKQGANANKIVQSQMGDIKKKKISAEEVAMPTETEEQETADRTRKALEALLDGKIKSAKPTNVSSSSTDLVEANYVRYTPNPDAPGYNPAISQRVVKLVEAQVDPLEPPKHKSVKVPGGPGSPPVPVLHSPPRKLTVADQQAWKIPPCISNWKNARGFIIPLDKRLAADGRGLQEVTINNKFAMLSESLYIAERKAVQDLNIRNDLRKKIALKEKEEREQNLRDMANRARLERTGALRPEDDEDRSEQDSGSGSDSENSESDQDESDHSFHGETEEEKIARQQRERIRMDRRKEREQEMRLANMKGNLRKSKGMRDDSRDVSEKIALGMLKGTGKLTGESLYDSRLFNQSSGMDSGFGPEDEYNAYSKPLFDRGEATSIYRPKKSDTDIYGDPDAQLAKLKDTTKFKPDKGFKGADGMRGGPRSEPVQFESANSSSQRRHDNDSDDNQGHNNKRSRYNED